MYLSSIPEFSLTSVASLTAEITNLERVLLLNVDVVFCGFCLFRWLVWFVFLLLFFTLSTLDFNKFV